MTFQLIKFLRWAEVRTKLVEKGNDLKLESAIKVALEYQATTNNTSRFERSFFDTVKPHNCLHCGSK